MGIVKISDEMHEDVRRASSVMCRSINAQAEFWMKIGKLMEANPELSYSDIIKQQFEAAQVQSPDVEMTESWSKRPIS